MFKSIMALLFVSIQISANSLYSDQIQDAVNIEKQQLESAYEYAEDNTKKNAVIAADIGIYMQSIFTLSQLTSGLATITDETKIYSDINRLDSINIELSKMLSDKQINYNYQPIGSLSKLQSYYQQTMYKYHVISPYIPELLNNEQEKVSYFINYIATLTNQIQKNMQEMFAMQQKTQLTNTGQLPFTPQNPQQLSFALENQLNSSIINMLNSNDTSSMGSGMPYSDIATPPNTDVFNQSYPQNLPNSPSMNASPLQMMNYMPTF